MKYSEILLFLTFSLISINIYCTTADFRVTNACYKEPTMFTSTSTSKDSIISQLWDLNGNGIFNDGMGQIALHVYGAPGQYSIGLRIITDVGDTVTNVKLVEIYPKPTADLTYENPCAMDTTKFSDASGISTGTVSNFFWDYGDGDVVVYISNPMHIYTNDGIYNVQMIAISDQGCKDTINKSVTVHPEPIIEFQYSRDTVFFEGDSLTISLSSNFPTIIWSSDLWTTNREIDSITIGTTSSYSVYIVDKNGCAKRKSTDILVMPQNDLVSLDILTPNDDNINDEWVIKNLEAFEKVEVFVYNRYGEEVYSNLAYHNDWEGTYEGNPLPEGTYYYIMTIVDNYDSKNGKTYKGAISILR